VNRTTAADLDELARIINRALGLTDRPDDAYDVEYAYGRPRLYRAGGSREVSPRLSTGELAEWMRAYIDGIDAARRRP
jgi:hypothetical protein